MTSLRNHLTDMMPLYYHMTTDSRYVTLLPRNHRQLLSYHVTTLGARNLIAPEHARTLSDTLDNKPKVDGGLSHVLIPVTSRYGPATRVCPDLGGCHGLFHGL